MFKCTEILFFLLAQLGKKLVTVVRKLLSAVFPIGKYRKKKISNSVNCLPKITLKETF